MEKREAGRKCLDEDFPFFIEFYVKLANMAGSASQFSHPLVMGAIIMTGIERVRNICFCFGQFDRQGLLSKLMASY